MPEIRSTRLVEDVIKRRLGFAPEEVRSAVIGTSKFDFFVWSNGQYVTLCVGSNTFVKTSKRRGERFGDPLYGLISKREIDGAGGFNLYGKGCSIGKLTLESVNPPIFIGEDIDVTFFDIALKSPLISYSINLSIVKRYSGIYSERNFAQLCEVAIAKLIDQNQSYSFSNVA